MTNPFFRSVAAFSLIFAVGLTSFPYASYAHNNDEEREEREEKQEESL
jgi:hypothetical protein